MPNYRVYRKIFGCCNNCPNIEINQVPHEGRFKYWCEGKIPCRLIFEGLNNNIEFPEWCPLDEVDI